MSTTHQPHQFRTVEKQTAGAVAIEDFDALAVPVHRAALVADLGANHDGSLERALAMLEAAAGAGADAVEVAAEDCARLMSRCAALGLEVFSTPFDSLGVEALAAIDGVRWKVDSGDLANLPLLRAIGAAGKPVLLSTEAAADAEIAAAVEALDRSGAPDVALLHLVSRAPAPPADLQLLRIPALRDRFGLRVGYSDLAAGFEAALGARALGATLIVKRFTLDRGLPGPDHAASLDPPMLQDLVERVRLVESMLGTSERVCHQEEPSIREAVRTSIVALREIQRGGGGEPLHHSMRIRTPRMAT
jgi:sialic acid synthase SpsE